jgi:integrase
LLDPDIADPVAGIRPGKILKPVDEEHFASLPIEEIPELLRRMRNYNGTALTRIALELIALTFLRTGELTGGLWREINWEEKRWNILKERMKGIKARKKPHIVPLSEQALVLLKQLHSITGKSDRMFPVATGGPGVISENTILQAIGHMGYKGRMTGHGWRSVASTYLNEHGFDSDHIEVQLAHCEGNDVKAAYNYAKYMVPRAAMMQAWADALDQLREQERTEFAA